MENFNWRAALIKLGGKQRIAVHFERTKALIVRFRKIPGAKWCNRLKVWHLPDTPENRIRFRIQAQIDPLADKKNDIDKFTLWLKI